MTDPPTLLGLSDVARMLDVPYRTVVSWRQRGKLPEPDGMPSGVPVWWRETIETWAEARKGN